MLPKNTIQLCSQPGHEPGPLAPWSCTLTMRPLHLSHIQNAPVTKLALFVFRMSYFMLTRKLSSNAMIWPSGRTQASSGTLD